jgi:1-acyl-sn-glycerol-3-phosphate acyltransferase
MGRAVWRLLRTVGHVLHGVLIVLLRFPSLTPAARETRVGWWAAKVLRGLGLELKVRGRFKPGAKLIVANHVSWLDIMVVHAVCPQARFVSKADVQAWPLLNRLIDSARTLYIRRESRRDALRVVHDMAAALQAGDTVAVFPEGTTGTGPELLPFHANLLQAAIATGAAIQPVALRYADSAHRFSPAACWVGEVTLLGSLWALARSDGLVVHLDVIEPQTSAHADRRALTARLRALIAERLAAP